MLYVMDLDGTVVRSFMREGGGGADRAYDLVELLPKRRETIERLRKSGHDVAFATNQGGVAFGYQTQPQVVSKLVKIADELGIERSSRGSHHIRPFRGKAGVPAVVYVSFGHPNARIERYVVERGDDWRKPGGGMIEQAMLDYGYPAIETAYVGDMVTDMQAAKAAGVRYIDVNEFAWA